MTDSLKLKGLRKRLVEGLHKKGIVDQNVLNAINCVPRHLFFPADFLSRAYEDAAFPIEENQTISQPFTVAWQSQLLDVTPGMRVLEVGTGSGYQSAVLCEMGAEVYTIERHEQLYRSAAARLAELKYPATCIWGDGTAGAPKYAPFDRILVTAAAPEDCSRLESQLAEGGKLVVPIGDKSVQRMMLVTRGVENNFTRTFHGEFKFVPLVGKYGWKPEA